MKFKKLSAILMALTALTLLSPYILPAAYTKESTAVNFLSDSTLTDSTKVTYTCPMHPEVTSDKPGQCPKCGMDLVPKKTGGKDEGMNCPNIDKCKDTGCSMDNCRGQSGGCTSTCPKMNEHMDHNSKESNDDNSNEHQHKSGCSKKGC